jgi:outer membrane immunogenic protein
MPGAHRFAVVGAALLSVATVSGAFAADIAPRTYTKAPPPVVAPVYDWSGFYIGINGGGASSHDCYTIADVPVIPNSEGCHDAAWSAVSSAIAGKSPIGCSALKGRAIGLT